MTPAGVKIKILKIPGANQHQFVSRAGGSAALGGGTGQVPVPVAGLCRHLWGMAPSGELTNESRGGVLNTKCSFIFFYSFLKMPAVAQAAWEGVIAPRCSL